MASNGDWFPWTHAGPSNKKKPIKVNPVIDQIKATVQKAVAQGSSNASVVADHKYASPDSIEQKQYTAGGGQGNLVDTYADVNKQINDYWAQFDQPTGADASGMYGPSGVAGGSSSGGSGGRGRGGKSTAGTSADPAAIQAYLATLQQGQTDAMAPYDKFQTQLDTAHGESGTAIQQAIQALLGSVNEARTNVTADSARRDALLAQSNQQMASAGSDTLAKAIADITAQGGDTSALKGRYASLQANAQQQQGAQGVLTARLDSAQQQDLIGRGVDAPALGLGATQGLEKQYAQLLAQLLQKRTDTSNSYNDKIAQFKLQNGLT